MRLFKFDLSVLGQLEDDEQLLLIRPVGSRLFRTQKLPAHLEFNLAFLELCDRLSVNRRRIGGRYYFKATFDNFYEISNTLYEMGIEHLFCEPDIAPVTVEPKAQFLN